jgi:hypothetical protein
VGGQRHAPAALPPRKTRYPLYRRLGGPQGRSGRVRKMSPPAGFGTRTVQPNLIIRMEIYYPATSEKLNFQHGKKLRKLKIVRRHLFPKLKIVRMHLFPKLNGKRKTGAPVRSVKTVARLFDSQPAHYCCVCVCRPRLDTCLSAPLNKVTAANRGNQSND